MVPRPPPPNEPCLPDKLGVGNTCFLTAQKPFTQSSTTQVTLPRNVSLGQSSNHSWGSVGNPTPASRDSRKIQKSVSFDAWKFGESSNEGQLRSEERSNPSRGSDSKGEFVSDDEFRLSRGCCQRILQQERSSSNFTLWFYRKSTQWKMAGFCMLLFLGLGGFLILSASQAFEIVISYGSRDRLRRFVVERDIPAPLHVSFVLPGLKANYKAFVSSKDPDIFSSTWSKTSCDDVEDLNEFVVRRGITDPEFQSLVTAPRDQKFRPCGLQSLTLFTDRFELYQCGTGSVSPVSSDADCIADVARRVALNETDLTTKADASMFDKRFRMADNGSVKIVDRESGADIDSWLIQGPMLEHFKVWSRTPASPHIRNLWAWGADTLLAGEYVLAITHNSAVWESWGIEEKQVLISNSHVLGSQGACITLAVFCMIVALVELFMFAALFVVPANVQRLTQKPTFDRSRSKNLDLNAGENGNRVSCKHGGQLLSE